MTNLKTVLIAASSAMLVAACGSTSDENQGLLSGLNPAAFDTISTRSP